MIDNALTFMSAAEDLKALFKSGAIKECLGVDWKFIPCHAPWYGGYWEHLIGLTKSAIKKTLGRPHITLSSLQTIIVEIEAHLNNRPLHKLVQTRTLDTISPPLWKGN